MAILCLGPCHYLLRTLRVLPRNPAVTYQGGTWARRILLRNFPVRRIRPGLIEEGREGEMAFMAKELGRLVARLGHRAKGTPRGVAVEDVAGGPFFSTTA